MRFAVSQNERLQYIDSTIREKGIVTVSEVASKFEVSIRTVKRDIEYLRDRIGAPIQYIPHKRGYVYSHPFDYFTYHNEKIFLFYIFLMRLINSPTHFPYIDETIVDNVKKLIKNEYLPLISRITYEMDEWEILNFEVFEKLFYAMRKNKIASINYVDAKGEQTIRDISPEQFIHYEGRWYLIAFDENINELRTFLISRIKNVSSKNINKKNKISQNDLQKYIEANYGIYKGKKGTDVCIRFYEPVNNLVKKQIWHKSQKINEGNHSDFGKYVEMTLPVHHPQELLGKVLRYGKYAEIVSPEDVRKLWIEAIEEAYFRYCKEK